MFFIKGRHNMNSELKRYEIDFEKVIPNLLKPEFIEKAKKNADEINKLKFDYYKSRNISPEELNNKIDI